MSRFKLLLTSLKFVSSVDTPAQETAQALLLKRAPNAPLVVKTTAKVLKVSDELGLVFGWALTTKVNGVEYYDLHGDNIVEDDLIKIAAEWMAGGGAADTMHDRVKDGGAVFCMPVTSEVAKAFFGDKFDAAIGTYGLMVAIKPSAEDFAKFKSGELAGFSIDGTGIREPVETKSVAKSAVYTTEVDGHAHTVEVSCTEIGASWYTSYQNAADAPNGHSHAVIRNADGSLTILADSGHSHEVDATSPTVIVVPADAVVVVENAAPDSKSASSAALKSTRPIATPKVDTMPNADAEKQLADLTKRNERLDRIAKMSGAHKSHFDTLTGDDAESFLGKSLAERDAAIAKAAENDPVEVEFAGKQYRKSAGENVIALAKAAKAQADANAALAETIEKADIRKAALDQLGGMPGDDATHDYIVKSIRKGGGDAAMVEKATAVLKGMKATSTLGKKAPGAGGLDAPQSNDAQAQFDDGVAKLAAEKGISIEKATAAFVETAKGVELYTAIQKAKTASAN